VAYQFTKRNCDIHSENSRKEKSRLQLIDLLPVGFEPLAAALATSEMMPQFGRNPLPG
jgi:hypothetical protein